MAIELWKDIPGYEGRYQVSNLGRVKSLQRWDSLNEKVHQREKVLKQSVNRKGYMKVKLYSGCSKKAASVHRLVAMAFIHNLDRKDQVNHIDGNKGNNNAENLEWCTNQENQKHAREHGLASSCRKKGKKVIQFDMQGNRIKEWINIKAASEALGIHSSKICGCCKGRAKAAGGYIWKYKEVVCNG